MDNSSAFHQISAAWWFQFQLIPPSKRRHGILPAPLWIGSMIRSRKTDYHCSASPSKRDSPRHSAYRSRWGLCATKALRETQSRARSLGSCDLLDFSTPQLRYIGHNAVHCMTVQVVGSSSSCANFDSTVERSSQPNYPTYTIKVIAPI